MAACLVRVVVPKSWLKLVKYASVSLIATGTSLTILAVLGHLRPTQCVVQRGRYGRRTIPSFALKRRWVWSLGGSKPTLRQVVPFCALAFTGLAASSIAVHFASNRTVASSHLIHTVAVEGSIIATFGALCVLEYALCNRVPFAQCPNRVPAAAPIANLLTLVSTWHGRNGLAEALRSVDTIGLGWVGPDNDDLTGLVVWLFLPMDLVDAENPQMK